MLSFTELEQIWIIVSPHNPLKDAQSLIHAYDRLEMCKLAFEDEVNIQVKDIELHLPQPSYTIDTLTYLGEKYPQHQFQDIQQRYSQQEQPELLLQIKTLTLAISLTQLL